MRRFFSIPLMFPLLLISYNAHSTSEQRKAFAENLPNTQNSANFYDRRSEGWYFYDDPELAKKKELEKLKPVEQPKPLEQPKPVEQPKQVKNVDIFDPQTNMVNKPIVLQADEPKIKPLSSEWLKNVMPRQIMLALDKPFDDQGRPSDDMKAYIYMQRLSLDKAQNFSKSAQILTQTDPFLDETARIPIDTAANKVFSMALEKDKEDIVKNLTKFTGLWFFYDAKCSFCHSQYQYLQDFNIKHNFKTMMISMDGSRLPQMTPSDQVLPDRGQAKRLQLRVTPSIVLVAPPNNFYVVSQGLITSESLLNKILLVAEQQNLLTKEQKEKLDPYSKGVLTQEQIQKMQNLEDELNNDPTKIVNLIKQVVGHD